MWLKNSKGKRDAMLTISMIGFIVVILKVLLNGSTVQVGSFQYSFGLIDAGMIAAILTPTLGAYVARKHSDNKTQQEAQDKQ